MTLPVTVSFRDLPPSAALRADIEEHAQRLLRFAPRLQACEVIVSRSENRHHQGNRYRVHVSASLPGRKIEAGRAGDDERGHEDAYVAVRDAFDALRRQLEDFVRIRRGETKTHPGERSPE